MYHGKNWTIIIKTSTQFRVIPQKISLFTVDTCCHSNICFEMPHTPKAPLHLCDPDLHSDLVQVIEWDEVISMCCCRFDLSSSFRFQKRTYERNKSGVRKVTSHSMYINWYHSLDTFISHDFLCYIQICLINVCVFPL